MYEQLIHHIRSVIHIRDQELEVIDSYFQLLTVKRNELLLAQGQINGRTFFVNKGCLRIYFIHEESQDSTRHFSFEGQFARALVSFITFITYYR
jgi:CRP-like cAMP-binding protein